MKTKVPGNCETIVFHFFCFLAPHIKFRAELPFGTHRDSPYDDMEKFRLFILSCILCIRCCQCLCVFHS
jgi:hypothetical protein